MTRTLDINKSLAITSRDMAIIGALDRFRILSLEQVWAGFFRGDEVPLGNLFLWTRSSARGVAHAAYRRLWRLASLGFVEHRSSAALAHIYRIGPRGLSLLRGIDALKSKRIAPWPPDPRHPLMVAAAGLYFSRVLRLPIVSERELWSRRKRDSRFADAPLSDLVLLHRGVELRVEVELSDKGEDRYSALWERLGVGLREETAHTLYLAKDARLAARLLSYSKNGFFPGIYAAAIPDLDEHGLAPWRNFAGKELTLQRCGARGNS